MFSTRIKPHEFGGRVCHGNGLTGHDIIITGHSLGGLAVNSMATLSAQGQWVVSLRTLATSHSPLRLKTRR